MIYDFDELLPRAESECIKWHYFDEDVLPMWVADMDFRSPEPVVEAIVERAQCGVFGYAGELCGLREAIAARMLERYGWRVEPDWIVFVPGVVTGFMMAANAFAGAGKGVLIQPPVYMPFLDVAKHCQGSLQQAELTLDPDGSYTVDWERFEAAITPETGMFLLCSPHNPVGRVFTRPELERMAETCLRRDFVICSDEIHSDLVFPGHTHIPLASLDKEIERKTVTLVAPSKTFNIAGLACSAAIVPDPGLRKRFEQGGRGLVHGVNLMGLVAAKAAYEEGQEWLDQLLSYLKANRDFLSRFVSERLPGVRMKTPEATYLGWLDCRESRAYDLESKTTARFFLEKARVGLNEGTTFGQGGEGFVRLNFGCPRSMLREALERMEKALGV